MFLSSKLVTINPKISENADISPAFLVFLKNSKHKVANMKTAPPFPRIVINFKNGVKAPFVLCKKLFTKFAIE